MEALAINILDIMDQIEIPAQGEDLLPLMFSRQEELMREYIKKHLAHVDGIDPVTLRVDLNSKVGQARIREFMEYVIEELMEAANCLRNKPWQATERPTDVAHFYEELSDAVHFLLEMFIMVGIKGTDLYKLYMAKSEVNKFRQRSDY